MAGNLWLSLPYVERLKKMVYASMENIKLSLYF